MADNQTRVTYKALADFASVTRAVGRLRRNVQELRQEQAKLNAESVAGAAATETANGRAARSFNAVAGAVQRGSQAAAKTRVAFKDSAGAAQQTADAIKDVGDESNRTAQAQEGLANVTRRVYREMLAAKQAADGAAGSQRNLEGVTRRAYREMQEQARANTLTARTMRTVVSEGSKLNGMFRRLGNWRPRLTPPFIALIPIIAGVIGLINPLVAGLGAVSSAALGFASSLGTVAGGALAVVPALTTLLSVVAALKVGFGGIGNAFKAFSQMKQATGGAGSGTPQAQELSQTEELARAQDRYARSIQNVAWAQEDLDDARADYIKRLRELQRAVDRAAMSEARAAANSQLAKENYANVLADPGSTKGMKMDAKVGVEEASADFQDVVADNKQNLEDLNRMKREGMAGDRQVIQAQRALTDAIYAQRDAQLDLVNTQTGANKATTAAATAANLYEDALNKLSPSARRFVENLISMNDEWTALKRNVQESFFREIADDVLKLRDIFPSLEYLLSRTAGALGRVASSWIDLVTSPEWRRDFMIIGDQNVPIIENVGDGLGSLATGFKDLAIAAGPFLEALSVGFKDGADNLERMIAGARADGSLASYLEEVREKMSQWWRIVKNIGTTLFNYSAAASDFGDWLTDGFEKVTEGWLKSSEAARQEGSPFKEYLEDIKPLLSEVKGLFADFFGWFARTAADEDNIQLFTDLVKLVREDLGPAVSAFLDEMSKSGAGEAFVSAISAILEALTAFFQNGGLSSIKVFFDVLTTLLDFLKGIMQIPGVGAVLGAIATGFAALAAVTFVGKFTGITTLIGWLLKLARGGGNLPSLLQKIFGSFRGVPPIPTGGAAGGAAGAAGAAAGAAGTVVAPTSRRAPGGGSYKPPRVRGGGIAGLALTALSFLPGLIPSGGGGTSGGSTGDKKAASGLDVLGTFGRTAKGGADAGKGFNLLGSIAKGAGKGVGIAAIASIAGTVVGDLISSGSAEGKAGGGQRVGGGMLAGAASGAGIGALLGSLIPIPGVGTGVGAAVGAVAGGAIGFATSSDEDKAAMFEEMGNFFRDVGGWIADVSGQFWNWLTVEVPAAIGTAAEGFWTWLTVDVPGWVASVAEGFYTWLTVDLPFALGYIVESFRIWLMVDLPAWLGTVWTGFMTWLTVDMPAWLATVWQGFMTWLTVDLPAWLSQIWTGFMTWLTVDMPRWLAQVWQGFMTWLTVDLPRWIGQAWTGFMTWLTVDLPRWIGEAAGKFWTWLTVDLPKSVVDAGKAIGDGFTKFFTDFFSNTGSFFKTIGDAWNNFWGGIFGNFGAGQEAAREDAGGGPPGSAGGGSTYRKVASILPNGMRISSVFRTPAENRAAGGSATSLHMDRQNPAVDIVGSIPQMNAFARILGAIGGWRQLYYNNIKAPGVGYWPGHSDHIHVANTGGQVPGTGNGDTVPSMLTPGEFVIKKSIVGRIGADNLHRLNSGVLSYAQMLQRGLAESQKNKQKGDQGGTSLPLFFSGGGLVPGATEFDFPTSRPPGPDYGEFPAPGGGGSAPVIAGDVNITNATPEPASDSLARTIRKAAYLGGRDD